MHIRKHSALYLQIFLFCAHRWPHPERQPVDMRVRTGMARPLAEAVAARDDADTHGGAGGGPADAEPCQRSYMHRPKDGTTDPVARSLS
jgi:hypothetical protein